MNYELQARVVQYCSGCVKNNATLLSENEIKKFSSVIQNLNYGWDSSIMCKVKDHFKDWISKKRRESTFRSSNHSHVLDNQLATKCFREPSVQNNAQEQ